MHRNKISRFLAAAGLAAGIALGALPTPPALGHDGPSWERYDALYERELGLRRRVADLEDELARSREREARFRDLYYQANEERERLLYRRAEPRGRSYRLRRKIREQKRHIRILKGQIMAWQAEVNKLRRRLGPRSGPPPGHRRGSLIAKLQKKEGAIRALNAQVARLGGEVNRLRRQLQQKCAPRGRRRPRRRGSREDDQISD